MSVTAAQRSLTYLNIVGNQESSKMDAEQVTASRQRKITQQTNALEKQEEAGNIRGDASDTQQTCNAIATGLGAAAAVCACFPPIGTIIAAVLAVIAAVLAIYAACQTNGKQQEAAEVDHDAGSMNVMAEKEQANIDEAQEDRKERRASIQQNIQQLLAAEAEDRQTHREALS